MKSRFREHSRALGAFALLLAAPILALGQASPTQVNCGLVNGNGSPVNGQIIISWPEFFSEGVPVAAGSEEHTITNGMCAPGISLIPTDTAVQAVPNLVPAYTVETNNGGVRSKGVWLVPTSDSPVGIEDIQVSSPPGQNFVVLPSQISTADGGDGQVLCDLSGTVAFCAPIVSPAQLSTAGAMDQQVICNMAGTATWCNAAAGGGTPSLSCHSGDGGMSYVCTGTPTQMSITDFTQWFTLTVDTANTAESPTFTVDSIGDMYNFTTPQGNSIAVGTLTPDRAYQGYFVNNSFAGFAISNVLTDPPVSGIPFYYEAGTAVQNDAGAAQLSDFAASVNGATLTVNSGTYNGQPVSGAAFSLLTLPVISVSMAALPGEVEVADSSAILSPQYVWIENAVGCDALNGMQLVEPSDGMHVLIDADLSACGSYTSNSATMGNSDQNANANAMSVFVANAGSILLYDANDLTDGLIVSVSGNGQYALLDPTAASSAQVSSLAWNSDNTWAVPSGAVPFFVTPPASPTCAGDLAGTFPNCTVAGVGGIVVPASSTGDLVAFAPGNNGEGALADSGIYANGVPASYLTGNAQGATIAAGATMYLTPTGLTSTLASGVLPVINFTGATKITIFRLGTSGSQPSSGSLVATLMTCSSPTSCTNSSNTATINANSSAGFYGAQNWNTLINSGTGSPGFAIALKNNATGGSASAPINGWALWIAPR